MYKVQFEIHHPSFVDGMVAKGCTMSDSDNLNEILKRFENMGPSILRKKGWGDTKAYIKNIKLIG